MKIATFNLRCVYDRDVDGINVFVNRAGLVTKKICKEHPDVIGFQEAIPQIVADLRRMLPDYTILFNQRNADFSGEGLALAIRNDRVQLVTLDCFWLSETPFVPGSRYAHQSDCPRICQAALLKTSENAVFRVYNVHLDHVDDEARILGISQVLAYMAAEEKKLSAPAFLLGDFNAGPDSGTIALCNSFAALPLIDMSKASGATFHDFGRREEPIKIDYIYADAKTAKKPFALCRWEDCLHGVYLSDHYPVAVEVEI